MPDVKARAAGVAFVAPGAMMLFLKRSGTGDHAGEWCFPGGGIEGTETAEKAARREVAEETGSEIFLESGPLVEADRRTSAEGVDFTTFRQPVVEEFVPVLNEEHCAFRWAPVSDPPNPLHPGVRVVLSNVAMDSRAGEKIGVAFDRGSVRTYDRDGRLHVAKTHISKANVCPYVGREIPDWETLRLDPDRIYKLFRDPEELEKAAPTFNNIPLLSRHVEVTADDHQPDLVIGSTGTDAEFSAPFLDQSLVIWAKPGISAVESEARKELSSAYRYRADMTPGEFQGEKYDGVMRDIVGNHVALVKEGRAGADVVVGDSMENLVMSKTLLSRTAAFALGGVAVFIAPKLAMDAKVDLAPLFKELTSKNFKDKKAGIVTGIKALTKDKLAKDASIDDVVELMDKLEAVKPGEDAEATEASAALPVVMPDDDTSMDADPLAKIKALLEGKIDPTLMAEIEAAMAGGAVDEETPEAKAAREKKEADEKAAKDAAGVAPEKKPVTQKAMDEALKSQKDELLATQRGVRDAERAVRPYVGELAMSFDTAEQVYRTALKNLGVKGHDTIHESALKTVLEMQPIPGSKKRVDAPAMDAAGTDAFAKRYPDATRIQSA